MSLDAPEGFKEAHPSGGACPGGWRADRVKESGRGKLGPKLYPEQRPRPALT